jgi:glycosyltransferase involved in cell wall biosynthesis
MKISVIVPIYNTEQYLSRCLDSIISQSFTDFELLLIDDGSTDGSGLICDSYADRDRRIRVFHKQNGGVSSARNLGIDKAQGEWLYFVDSDDELLPGGLSTLVDNISDDVDVTMGGFESIDELGNVTREATKSVNLRLSRKESVITLYRGQGCCGYFFLGYTWQRLFRKSLVDRFSLRFDTSIAVKEDTLFVMQYVRRSNGITQFATQPIYRYCQRPNSAMEQTKQGFDPKYVSSFYALVKMKHEVDSMFNRLSMPSFVAKQAVYDRYISIIGIMDDNQVKDEDLRKELCVIMREEIGSVFLFKVRRKLRKLMKKQVVYES